MFRILFFLPILAVGASNAATTSVRLARTHEVAQPPLSAVIKITPLELGVKPVTLKASIPGDLQLDLPERLQFKIEIDAPGLYFQPRIVSATDIAGRTLELLSTGLITGRIENKTQVPQGIEVTFKQPASKAVIESSVSCPVKTGRWSCELPEGVTDIKLHIPGFISRYKWNLPIEAGKTVDTGSVSFAKGASLTGFVEIQVKGQKAEGIRVDLRPQHLVGTDPETQKKNSLRTETTTTVKNGFFHFDQIAPGSYYVSVTSGGLVSESRSVLIVQDLEAQLKAPLQLRKPSALSISIIPPVDPWNKPWFVELLRSDPNTTILETAGASKADDRGVWRGAGLLPGEYVLKIERKPQGTWFVDDFSIDSDTQRTVEIPLQRVNGAVTLGKKPIHAFVWFGGSSGSFSVPVGTDDQGKFRAILPRPKEDRWPTVEVVSDKPVVRKAFKDVSVKASESDVDAYVQFDVSRTGVYGVVIGPDSDTPTGKTVVSVRTSDSDQQLIQVLTDEGGSFSLYGLPPGHTVVRAYGAKSESKPVTVDLVESSDRKEGEYVQLRLEKKHELQGIVTSQSGPLAGARIFVMPENRTGAFSVPVTTDNEGNFSAELDPESHHVTITVAAPGFAFAFFDSAVTLEPVKINLTQSAGKLLLIAPVNSEPERRPFLIHRNAYLGMNNIEAFSNDIRSPLSGGNPAATIASAEPGRYSLCSSTLSEIQVLANASVLPKDRCVVGELAPFGELTLTAPHQKP